MADLRDRMVSTYRTGLDAWMRNSWVDWLTVGLVVGGHTAGYLWFGVGPLVEGADEDLVGHLRFVVGVLATLSGFLLTAVIFFYGMDRGIRLRVAEQVLGDSIFRAWRGGVVSTLLGAGLLGLLALRPISVAPWVLEAVALLVALRVGRLVRVLFDFISLYRTDREEPEVPTVRVGQPTPR